MKYINIDSKIKYEKQKNINELKNLKDIHEKEDLKKSNQEPKSIKKSDQEPKNRKRADQEPKSRKRADYQGKGYVDLPIFLSKLNINMAEPHDLARSSKELINNIKQLINDLCDNEQITKQVYNNIIKAITYKK